MVHRDKGLAEHNYWMKNLADIYMYMIAYNLKSLTVRIDL